MKPEILQEIVRALQLHGASLDYIATVGSLGDTLPDDEVLGLLQTLNDQKEKIRTSLSTRPDST